MIHLYTDGACSPNPGHGGLGWVWVADDDIIYQGSEPIEEYPTTNNRAELLAILSALKAVGTENDKREITIYSDSKWCINCLTGIWKPKKNQDILERIKSITEKMPVVWKWVKGHNGNKWNEHADYLATSAIKKNK